MEYLKWADELAWAHWADSGLTKQDCADLDLGMAIVKTTAEYLGHVRLGDEIDCAVWIPVSDGGLRAQRWYQFRHKESHKTVFRAITHLAPISYSLTNMDNLVLI